MIYLLLAELVLLLHALFVIFVIFGGIFSLYRWWWKRIHLPALAWGVLIEWGGWICPLTPLEAQLRRLAHQEGAASGIIEPYLLPLLYPVGLTREDQWLLAILLLGFNAVIYSWIWLRR